MSNTITYSQDFEDILQERLDHPQVWKEVLNVTYSNERIINSSYESTQAAVQTGTRGTGITFQDYAQTNNTLTISTYQELGEFVDWADLAQYPWTVLAEKFARIGTKLNEAIEAAALARHASWTNFGAGDLAGTSAGDTAQITVSASNIDDIIRAVKRTIRVNNGASLMNSNGVCFVWIPQDFEFLEAFDQANGFTTADEALRNGTDFGLKYFGAQHYWSNDYTANHLFAGVKKIERIGILKATYGRAHTIDFPAAASASTHNLSGVAAYSRVDYGGLTPGGLST